MMRHRELFLSAELRIGRWRPPLQPHTYPNPLFIFKSISPFCTWQSIILPPFLSWSGRDEKTRVVRLCWAGILLRTWALFWLPLWVPAWSLHLGYRHWVCPNGYVSICNCTFFSQLRLALCEQRSRVKRGTRQEVTGNRDQPDQQLHNPGVWSWGSLWPFLQLFQLWL